MQSSFALRPLVLVATALLLTLPVLAEAQLPGAVRRNLPGGNRDNQRAQQPAQQQQQQASGPRITAAILEQFERALGTETAARAAERNRKQNIEANASRRNNCLMEAVQSPEYERIMERMAQAGERNDAAASQQVMQDMAKWMETKCGPDPNAPGESGSDMERRAAEEGGLTSMQYAMLKERIPAFCGANISDDADNVRVANAGVFSNEEVRTIKPRCSALMTHLRQIL